MTRGGDYYVTMTGSKENAGDFLIRHRAHRLLRAFRPDREVVDVDGWKPMSAQTLEVINGGRALLLCGGPSLQRRMVPRIYALPSLEQIRVPIVAMAVGWKARQGDWDETRTYEFDDASVRLLRRLQESGLASSVRDYHSAEVLKNHGVSRVVTTGCAALFDPRTPELPQQAAPTPLPRSVGFSLGVSQRNSVSMRRQSEAVIRALRAVAGGGLRVGLHHPAGSHTADARIRRWLDERGVPTVDLSGDHREMSAFYRDCDVHVGYRVHAHIFCASIDKPSVLICEDGRGRALRDVLGGSILDGYSCADVGPGTRALRAVIGRARDRFEPTPDLADRVAGLLADPAALAAARAETSRAIDRHYKVMRDFILQLP